MVEKAFILSLVAGLRLSTSPEDHSGVGLAVTFLKVRIMHTAFLSFVLFEVAASSCCCYFKQKNGVTGLSKKDCNTRLKQIPSMKIWVLAPGGAW